MKDILTLTLKEVLADRKLLLLSVAVLLGGLAYIGYVAFSLSPSDLQLATRYTSYGETQFYRSNWWYLLSFVGFGVLYVIFHIGMMAKLYMTGMRDLAYAFGWFSMVVLLLMFFYTYSVLEIAYLS
jgi:hypothetical protein